MDRIKFNDFYQNFLGDYLLLTVDFVLPSGYNEENTMEENAMSITVNIYYSGKNGSARRFVEEMREKIMELREKYDLHMKALRFVTEDVPSGDGAFIRK